MIEVFAREVRGAWFGLAHNEGKIIATAVGPDRERTLKNLIRSIPDSAEYQIAEKESDFAERTIVKLEAVHRGVEEFGNPVLATECVPEPLASVLRVAASIPVGYVASYGSIAKAAGTEPKVVGQIMASNPLYPIVACHRVVGADFSLVGYGGGKSPNALKAKLGRLSAECRGFKSAREISIGGSTLRMYPTERVIEKAQKQGLGLSAKSQRTLSSYR
jgi:O-6-methylguanine DNA methyltransferase